jgi:glycosyltransferase involved in cell wall biosynthesis
MIIGIYNRYWNSCGGGEKHIGFIAQELSKQHKVELICTDHVDFESISLRLRIDLSLCSFRMLENFSCDEISFCSSDYELFINSTYCSSLYPRSKFSAYMCFFPHEINTFRSKLINGLKKIKKFYKTERKLEKEIEVIPCLGSYDAEDDCRVWLAGESVLKFKKKKGPLLRLKLVDGSFNGINSILFGNKEVDWAVTSSNYLEILIPSAKTEFEIKFRSHTMIPSEGKNSSDTRSLGFCLDLKDINWNVFKKTYGLNEAIKKYDIVIANSAYTSRWIRKRWGRSSVLIEPPIDTDFFTFDEACVREKMIISVGRFFSGGHNKKHIELIELFAMMRADRVIPDDWMLVLIGSLDKSRSEHLHYFEQVVKKSKGLPVKIITDIGLDDLKAYYQKSYCYIHVTGWGEKIDSHPERFEHFGITTCEAMSSGCVPFVYDAAGSSEVVNSELVGFKFNSFNELSRKFNFFLNLNTRETEKIRHAARRHVLKYSKIEFDRKVASFMSNFG